ncbi:MAG: hypothetical protein K0S15_2115 [Solirubrobacterales bacterium]|jgi:hypothetical protein|nr:hypothetical protein [Solirubrobacterales bacterium]
MATTHETERGGTVVQSWLPHPLDRQLREHAAAERRSLSSAIRIAVEDKLRKAEERRP